MSGWDYTYHVSPSPPFVLAGFSPFAMREAASDAAADYIGITRSQVRILLRGASHG